MDAPAADPRDPIRNLAAVPPWLRRDGPETLDALAFRAGAGLAALHPLVAATRDEIPAALLRDRLALQAAEACARLIGRRERAAELRDEVHLLRPGDRPGPAGALFALWRQAARLPLDARGRGQLAAMLPEGAADLLASAEAAANPVTGASRALAAARQAWPGEAAARQAWPGEAAALVLAEAALARALGWPQLVPLLAAGLRRADLQAEPEALDLACHRAVARAAPAACALAADLARRAERLRQAAPKMRAKGAEAALRRFLAEDALAPGLALAGPRGSAAAMSERAARRLCDRLVALGALRELTGRASFRLYGL